MLKISFNSFSFSVLCLLLSVFCLSACIRLTGGAGVWKQGPEDEEPVTHQVGFDTNQLVPQSNSSQKK